MEAVLGTAAADQADIPRGRRRGRGVLRGALLLLATALGCESAIPYPDGIALEVARGRDPEVKQEDLEEGRRLYIRNCSGCHRLYLPARYADDEWQRWMEAMKEDAHLTPEEAISIGRYLLAVNG